MTFPIDFWIGSVRIDSHFVFETMAFAVGFRYFMWMRRKRTDPIEPVHRAWILFGAALGALLGSRLLGVFDDLSLLAEKANDPFFYFSSQTIVGGLLGGLAGTEITKWLLGVKVSSGDLMTFPIILAMMIGRVGCFLSGLEDKTYGVETSLPWGIDLGDGISRHPTSLYEIVFLGMVWLMLVLLEKKLVFADGSRFKLFMVFYLVFRLGIEFIKPVYVLPSGLSVIQMACIAGLIYYYRVWLFPARMFTGRRL